VALTLLKFFYTSVNPVHNAPCLSVTGPGVQADQARRGGGGERDLLQTDPARHSQIST
jgi:hypothetical protein